MNNNFQVLPISSIFYQKYRNFYKIEQTLRGKNLKLKKKLKVREDFSTPEVPSGVKKKA